MKKNKLKSLIKTARKSAKENIKLVVLTQLNEGASKLNLHSKKVRKEIEKSAKQLAKKLASEVKIDKEAITQQAANESATEKATPVAKESKQKNIKAKAEEPKAEVATA